ncbi:hypothetical protein [Deinococcus hopiensis]|uniref:Uncharacterized protein n=1 Tax=Deinococcus hopiensis KR-140 TaxID=695939 RepID=A0A1W1ULT8_9DEIO|nr:hypothetical protein [Deinococcus hopiensis]SMB82098.1 hypothetical protein SAMN00790413_04843 [Deinococcus hopiensis KR-140]
MAAASSSLLIDTELCDLEALEEVTERDAQLVGKRALRQDYDRSCGK